MSIDLLYFPFETTDNESENLHNVSLAVGILGRKEPIEDPNGKIAVAVEHDNGKLYASAHILLGEAIKNDYWGEGTAETMSAQATVKTIVNRVVVGDTRAYWYPRDDEGEPLAIDQALADNSETLKKIYHKLTKENLKG
jgi:serine/threonine protein phosphatase PrpC